MTPVLPGWRRDLAVAISLANVSYLRSWTELQWIHATPASYFARGPAGPMLGFTTLVGVTLLTGALLIALQLTRRLKGRVAELIADLFIFVALLWVAVKVASASASAFAAGLPALRMLNLCFLCLSAVLLVAVFISEIAHWPFAPIWSGRTAMLLLLPWAVFSFSQSIWEGGAYHFSSMFPDRLPTRRLARNEQIPGRFVWLIFDELDQQFIFDRRPPGLSLEEFDLFRSHALYATNAVPPAGNTLKSLPSLITGKVVSQAFPIAPDELELTLADGRRTVWSREPNIFAEARKSSLNTALAGWYHPYCRIAGQTLTACFSFLEEHWESSSTWSEYIRPLNFWDTLRLQAQREFFLGPVFRRFDGQTYREIDQRLGALLRGEHLRCFLDVRQNALEFLRDPQLTFLFLHIPVPHPQGIYDRRTGAFSLDAHTNYIDNLALADRFLGEARRILESSGSWDDATVLISSDHPFRKHLWADQVFWTAEMDQQTVGREFTTVPFLLKLPHQTASVTYASQFNTVVTKDLLLAIMHKEIRSSEDACRWLYRHRPDNKSAEAFAAVQR